ncbi:IS66 family insertion sequence element accessory protein TnpB [Paenibacillus sp. IB182496]|uniref:IS66 family insertion sequence element accessory protein TnpB n=1 Tax=Paenibacillus sabuli TaxID=2772509 RepID=A0A927BVA7_9BACL|nr:IS66 family insertion sequence element accessory protein TnpB [Paenibacillus sabuli]MBD2846561.1 IS66 family insertion sequence element accessory protein TnpB [Paenibacillus sabuli]
MLSLSPAQRVYLAPGATDLRKSIDALAAWVQEVMQLDPLAPCLFVFCNRRRDKLKLLAWDHNGFWLLYRRLESGRFQWPAAGDTQSVSVSARELRWLLDGLSLEQRGAHRQVLAEAVI